MKAKTAWVDISKGIVICLMVIGHSSLPPMIGRWIWSFHMPFFFFISALYTSWDREAFTTFCIRKAKVLLIPFLAYSVINWFLIPFSQGTSHYEYAVSVLHNGWGGIALWFVPVFFLSLIICKAIPSRWALVSGCWLMILGSILSWFQIELPWTLASVPFAAALMLLTRYFSLQLKDCISGLSLRTWFGIIILGMVASLYISHYWRLDMCCNNITPTLPILGGIMGGIAMIIGISVYLDKMPWLGNIFLHIGRNTYEIMALSQAVILTVSIFLKQEPLLRYAILIVVLIGAVYLRKLIEGRFSRVEAI